MGCVYCRSAFRWPARLVYAKLGHTDAHSFTQSVSYSPFPASLNIEPVETRWASAFAAGPAPVVRDVTIIVEEPLALVRRDFEAAGVKLNEFTFRPVTAPPNRQLSRSSRAAVALHALAVHFDPRHIGPPARPMPARRHQVRESDLVHFA